MQLRIVAKNKKRIHRKIVVIGSLVLASLLMAYGAWNVWQWYEATYGPSPASPTTVVTASTTTPSETPPSQACTDYKTEGTQPRKIEISSIDVLGCIQRVGIDQDNNIAVPNNIHVAGWYVNSPLPGEKGISVIDGHVLGRYNDAIFVKLKELRAGETIRIQRGDMTWLEFAVVDVEQYPVDEVMKHLFEPLSGTDTQLTLITCAGTFDSHQQTYDERVVVRAILGKSSISNTIAN